MTTLAKPEAPPIPAAERFLVGGLLLLTVLPALGGLVRLQHVGGGVAAAENARFLADPFPVVFHVLFSLAYAILGAFQFSAGFRRRYPRWHRSAGKALVFAGLVVALSGVWMTVAYPVTKAEGGLPGFDGWAVYGMRLVVGVAMAWFLLLGVAAIRKRDVAAHEAWMIRAYALALGAGTQAITHLPWFLFPAVHGELARALAMGAGWAINAAVAEWIIERRCRPSRGQYPGFRSERRNGGQATLTPRKDGTETVVTGSSSRDFA